MKLLGSAVICAVSLASASSALAQTAPWWKIHESSNTGFGTGVAVDKDGNIYTTGIPDHGYASFSLHTPDPYLAKFDANGNMLWSHNSTGEAVALDKRGNLFVVGGSRESPEGTKGHGESDVSLVKYDGSGKRLWIRLLGTPNQDIGHALAIDGGGNVYILASTNGAFEKKAYQNDWDISLMKVDNDGKLLWSRFWGTPGHETPYNVGVDRNGDVYVSGSFAGPLDGQAAPGANPFYCIKLGPNGDEKSKHVVSLDATIVDRQINDDGNFYVVGHMAAGATNGDKPGNLYIGKYDLDWKHQWTRYWQVADVTRPAAMVSDKDGNLFLAINIDLKATGFSQLALRKYRPDGHLAWERMRDTTMWDSVDALALDPGGSILLTGQTTGRLGEVKPQGARMNMFLLKYPPFPPPSFDCRKATSAQENLICQSESLSLLDASIAKTYKSLLEKTKNHAQVKAEQTKWLKTVRVSGTTIEQLELIMGSRANYMQMQLQQM